MYTPFSQLPDSARLWVYQANRPLTDAEVSQIDASLQPALSQWAAHGQPLLASAQMVANRFVVIAVDEGHNLPSGCSIDASTHFLKQIGGQLGADFFDRSAAYRDSDGAVQTLPLPKIKEAVLDGRLTPETTVFNTLVNTKADFAQNWLKPAHQTWLNRYFGRVIG
ncbi:MAG: hypothetical protein EAZ91_07020 [Cytophagales bacterium]|nr:MAG: hypothetical protein EAZ91_07020 [Cytophagales bacterium]